MLNRVSRVPGSGTLVSSCCRPSARSLAQQKTSKALPKTSRRAVESSATVLVASQPRHHANSVAFAGRDDAAAYKDSDDEDPQSLEGKWQARFVSDDEGVEQLLDRQQREQAKPEDPEAIAVAKEKFWGRIAVISLGAVLLSERLSGRGIVTALNMATGVPVWEIEPALGLIVGALLAAGIYPVIRKALNSSDSKNPGDVLRKAAWTHRDRFQVTSGRLACLVLAGTILAEATTGKGILALLNIETGVEITEIEAGLTFLLLLLFTDDLKAPK